MEKFKIVRKYPDYKIGDNGTVLNKFGRRLSVRLRSGGYPSVRINVGKKRIHLLIHRLVATEFVHNPMNKPFVNHKDSNRSNPCKDNLEWCTQKENIYHSRHVSRNGAIISYQRIKVLYEENYPIEVENFVELLLSNCK